MDTILYKKIVLLYFKARNYFKTFSFQSEIRLSKIKTKLYNFGILYPINIVEIAIKKS